MKKLIGRVLTRSVHLVNRTNILENQDKGSLGLYTSPSFSNLLKNELPSANEEHLSTLVSDKNAGSLYRYMLPFQLIAKISGVNLYFVAKAKFNPTTNSFCFTVVDPSGVFDHHMEASELIAFTYRDMIDAVPYSMPFNEVIDFDRVYKQKTKKNIFLFDKNGEWNSETANHPQISIEALFDELSWIDDQIPKK